MEILSHSFLQQYVCSVMFWCVFKQACDLQKIRKKAAHYIALQAIASIWALGQIVAGQSWQARIRAVKCC